MKMKMYELEKFEIGQQEFEENEKFLEDWSLYEEDMANEPFEYPTEEDLEQMFKDF